MWLKLNIAHTRGHGTSEAQFGDGGFTCLAAYNKSLTSSGRWLSTYLESGFSEEDVLKNCNVWWNHSYRKVFIDRGGVEILCSLLTPSTRVLHQDQTNWHLLLGAWVWLWSIHCFLQRVCGWMGILTPTHMIPLYHNVFPIRYLDGDHIFRNPNDNIRHHLIMLRH